jgi:ribose transport system substrate-binding protein
MKIRPLALAVVAGAALALTGCTPATGPGSAAPVTTAAANSCSTAMQQKVDAAKRPVGLLAPTAPLDKTKVAGKKVWLISATMNQAATEAANGFKAAAAALGEKATIWDGQGATNRFSEGVDQAVAQGAAGITLYGIDPSLVKSSLAKAAAAGIPVQNTLNGGPDDPVPAGTFDNLTLDPTADGALSAEWALADSGCKVDMIMLTLPTIPLEKAFADGATAAMKKYCPRDCTIKTLNIDLANFATSISSQLQTALQANPNANYVYSTFDSGVPFMTPVLAAANSKAKVMGHDGVQASLDLIAKKKGQDMTVAVPPLDWMGWLFVDDLSRKIAGDPSPKYVIPTQLVDTTNVGDGSVKDVFPKYVDYEQAFESAWAGK